MSADLLLAAEDVTAAATALGRYDLTHAIAELRRRHPRPEQFEHVAASAGRVLLDRHGWQPHARAVGMAVLLDCGHHDEVTTLLMERLQNEPTAVCDLLITGRLLRERGRINSSRWVHGLAAHLQDGGNALTEEVRVGIVDALAGPTPQWETIDTDVIDDLELEQLEGVVSIPGLADVTLRPIRSRGQCDRYSNRLRNCASKYVEKVKSGATSLFGIEMGGEPVELIEVRPCDGRIVQWKGWGNSEPEPQRRAVVERFMFEQRLAVPG